MNKDQTKISAIVQYLEDYHLFRSVCKHREEDLSSMEMAILHHGYVTGGQQNA